MILLIICLFNRLNRFDDFIEHYLGTNPGDIRDYKTNELIGHHRALWFHTIGQRKGIGLLVYPKVSNHGPFFVAAKDQSTNTLYLTNDLTILEKPLKLFHVQNINWILG